VKSVNYPVNSLTIPKLKKGAGYEFRVVAENVQGDSEPLLTTEPVIAENPFSELLSSKCYGGDDRTEANEHTPFVST